MQKNEGRFLNTIAVQTLPAYSQNPAYLTPPHKHTNIPFSQQTHARTLMPSAHTPYQPTQQLVRLISLFFSLIPHNAPVPFSFIHLDPFRDLVSNIEVHERFYV